MRFFLTPVALILCASMALAAKEDGEAMPALHVESHISLKADSGPAMLQHYGKPPEECGADEQAFQINGIPGKVCAPHCTDFQPCPTDVPEGVTALPQCALENRQTNQKYCVLICHPGGNGKLRGADDGCGDATCQEVQPGLGVCTWE